MKLYSCLFSLIHIIVHSTVVEAFPSSPFFCHSYECVALLLGNNKKTKTSASRRSMASLFLLRPSHLFRHASSRNKLSNSFSINIISRGHALWNSQRNLDEIDGEANTADITPPCASSSSQQGDDHNKRGAIRQTI
jgi:hypothetical protein